MSNHKSHMKAKAHRASGGRVAYSGGDSNVAKEAREKKRGGKVSGMAGAKGKHRVGRKSGGRVGSDTNPFSSAHRG